MTSPHPGLGLRVVASGDRDLILTRTFAAPASLVFSALTEPELLRRWYGARGWQLIECEIDLRPGGAWRFVSAGPQGAQMELHGVFHQVVPPRHLTQTEIHRDWADGAALVSTDLEETDGHTTMTVTAQYSSPEIRDTVLRSAMRRGAGEGYDRLDALLTELPPHLPTERTQP